MVRAANARIEAKEAGIDVAEKDLKSGWILGPRLRLPGWHVGRWHAQVRFREPISLDGPAFLS